MRQCWLLASVLMLMTAASAAAQFLDLDGAADAPPLDRFAYCVQFAKKLGVEIDELTRARAEASPIRQTVLSARTHYRVLAAELLNAGETAPAADSPKILAGFRLARSREIVDVSIGKLELLAPAADPNGPIETREAAMFRRVNASLNEFVNRVAERPRNLVTSDLDAFDRTMAHLLGPLADAVSVLDGALATSHWVAAADVADPAAAPRRDPLTVVRLRARVAQIRPAPAVADAFERQFDAIEAIDPSRRLGAAARLRWLAAVVEATERAGPAASWLSAPAVTSVDDALVAAVDAIGADAATDDARRAVEDIDRLGRLLGDVSTLAASSVDVRPFASALADLLARDDDASRRAALQLLATITERMVAYRGLDDAPIGREFEPIRQRLDQRYRDSEAALCAALADIAAHADALADPAAGSLVVSHRDALESLRRMRDVDRWRDTIALIDPAARGRFTAQVRKMCRWLLDRQRHVDAQRVMDQLDQQVRLFYPLPYEAELSRADPIAVQLTGGLHQDLLAVLHAQRVEWVAAWSEGDASSDAARRMLLLSRLLISMDDLSGAMALDPDAFSLNDWSAWDLRDDMLDRAVNAMTSRYKLATVAAVGGRFDELGAQLDRIGEQAAVTKLAGRLARHLAAPLRILPINAVSVLGQTIVPPGPDAWLGDQRTALASVCRYALEADHARKVGRDELADRLATYVEQVADELLVALGEPRRTLPELTGFDGSDPEAADPDAARGRRPSRPR